jgi:hypothetical protein
MKELILEGILAFSEAPRSVITKITLDCATLPDNDQIGRSTST